MARIVVPIGRIAFFQRMFVVQVLQLRLSVLEKGSDMKSFCPHHPPSRFAQKDIRALQSRFWQGRTREVCRYSPTLDLTNGVLLSTILEAKRKLLQTWKPKRIAYFIVIHRKT